VFERLTERLSRISGNLRGQGRLTEQNIQEALREVRLALLEADVALPVVKDFIEQVRLKAVGQDVVHSISPGQMFIKLVHDELVRALGETQSPLNLRAQPPIVVMMAGLQGSGKTTSTAKLSRWLKEKHNKKVALSSCDIYRPAAMEQLKVLAGQVDAHYIDPENPGDPLAIARQALDYAKRHHYDVLIVDTAGRLHIDETMMAEIQQLQALLEPTELLFVVDSMIGQDAVRAAEHFNSALPITGVVLTKVDGDARGGAALSVRQVTGKPIKFIGAGEKVTALEPLYPERLASRILGMGDIVGLVEQAQEQADQEKAAKIERKLRQGRGLDMGDFRDQLQQMQKMGGIGAMMDKLPGMAGKADASMAQSQDKQMEHMIAIIHSMTPKERSHPDIIRGSRKRRIASGSGTEVKDVNRLIKQFDQMQKMMKKMKGGGAQKMMRDLGTGQMPNFPGGRRR